jgi:hypothetical protein
MTPSNALTYSSARLGQVLAGQPDGDRADRLHVDQPGLAAQPPDLLDHAGGVGDRRGVGHRADRGVPAHRGRPRAGLHGLGILAAGLAQVRVQVDQAGQRHEAARVDRLVGRAGVGHDPVAQEQVGRLGAEQRHPLDAVRRHAVPPLGMPSWPSPSRPSPARAGRSSVQSVMLSPRAAGRGRPSGR